MLVELEVDADRREVEAIQEGLRGLLGAQAARVPRVQFELLM